MSKQFENLFGDIAQNIDIENINPENMSEDGGIPLGSIVLAEKRKQASKK